MDAPQLFVCAKGAPASMLEMLSVPAWLLRSVTLYAALVAPTPWLGKAITLGETEMFCARSPAHGTNASKRKPQRLRRSEITGGPPRNVDQYSGSAFISCYNPDEAGPYLIVERLRP